MNSLWAPWILENIWNFASRLVAAFICSIFITKLWTLDCCLAIMICIKYRNIFRNHWKVADTLLVLTDISFSPPSCNYPSTSPEMIGSCYHQTPCDHIYLSFWPRLPFPPSSITMYHCRLRVVTVCLLTYLDFQDIWSGMSATFLFLKSYSLEIWFKVLICTWPWMLAEPIGRGGSVDGPLGATVVNVRIGWRGRPLCLPGQEEEK